MDDAVIDLRSDTVTRPTPAMRAAMAAAVVGDDTYDEDPTVHALQERVASLLGKEAALFVPSGTMANQIALRVHTRPGDEMICETRSHVHVWEAGGPAVLSGITTRTVDARNGIIDPEQLQGLIRPDNEHYTRTRLVVLENTHNRGGGTVYPPETAAAIGAWARANGLSMHLDGARLWNAHIASGVSLIGCAEPFDSVSVCFSKGLGAPVGSAVVGSRDFVSRARRVRKLFGGQMRQAGVLAAAALHALEHHLPKLSDDHRHARWLAEAVREVPGLTLTPTEVATNLVWFDVDPAWTTAPALAAKLRQRGVWIPADGPHTLRACTHLDVSAEQARRAADAIRSLKV